MDFPILSSLILLPVLGAIFIFFSKSNNKKYQSSKYEALFISLANLILSIYLWYIFDINISEFQFNLIDLNNDLDINIVDVMTLVNIILDS